MKSGVLRSRIGVTRDWMFLSDRRQLPGNVVSPTILSCISNCRGVQVNLLNHNLDEAFLRRSEQTMAVAGKEYLKVARGRSVITARTD